MSTDLEFRQGLPQLRLPAIRIRASLLSETTGDDSTATIQTPKSGVDDECHTPKSPEHKIPAILICPPAPKKPKRSVSCKRKLCELEFFEIVAREEVESFFRSSFDEFVDVNLKRRCPCI
ncbi:hypothetical protein ACSBR1_007397 [Camellia fascicularis]